MPPSDDDIEQVPIEEITENTSPPTPVSGATDQTETSNIEPEQEQEALGRGYRERKRSTRYRDYVINTVTTIPTLTPSLLSSTPQLSS